MTLVMKTHLLPPTEEAKAETEYYEEGNGGATD